MHFIVDTTTPTKWNSFFLNYTAPTKINTLSQHDALPIKQRKRRRLFAERSQPISAASNCGYKPVLASIAAFPKCKRYSIAQLCSQTSSRRIGSGGRHIGRFSETDGMLKHREVQDR